MREDYYPNEYRFSREDYYPLGYRDDEEMCVYDQCCENCARQGCDCPFEDDDIPPQSKEGSHRRGCCHERSGAAMVHPLEADQAAQILRRPDERVRC